MQAALTMSDEDQTRLTGHGLNTFAAPTGIQNYGTPQAFKDALDAVYRFTKNPETGESYDPCPLNAFGMRDYDALGDTPGWVRSYFCNPPYGRKTKEQDGVEGWLKKAISDRARGVTSVYLLRVDTSTAWMHDYLFPYARPIWVRGRIAFKRPGPCKMCDADECQSPKGHPSPFASVAAAYEPGRFYPPQAVMWADDAGVWHLRTGDAAEVA
jgi:hypothetical protein